jgi:hypothetical protein
VSFTPLLIPPQAIYLLSFLLSSLLSLSHLKLVIIATFGGLFDFPDLSDNQSELSSPPDSSDSDKSACSIATKDKENT